MESTTSLAAYPLRVCARVTEPMEVNEHVGLHCAERSSRRFGVGFV